MERRDRTGTRPALRLGRANIRAAWWMIGGSMAVASPLPSSSRRVKKTGMMRWRCAFSPIFRSTETLGGGA